MDKSAGMQQTMPQPDIQTIAIVGLGAIGSRLAHQALDRGFQVVGANRSGPPEELTRRGLDGETDLRRVAAYLTPPRVVLLYVPAGAAVDGVISGLEASLEPGDVIVDGGNSYWGDSVRRQRRLKDKGIGFVDAGTSGGLPGAREGACFMVGGEDEDVATAAPVLQRLATEGGYVHAGGPGAGHFVKLVHNGIEFGMLQAIGEGVALLEAYPEKLRVPEVLDCWQNGSVVRSWLIDLMRTGYRKHGGLDGIPAHVEDTGEVNWLVEDAMTLEVPAPVITQSVIELLASRDETRTSHRAIAVMRNAFGGHPFGTDESIAAERRHSRLGGFPDGE
jgi:6-phosphogluconate dehydrogenase